MNNQDEKMVYIGKGKINIIGLKEIFEEAKKKSFTNESELKDFLLKKVEEKNYVAESAEQEYRDSIYHEFRVYTGELKERKITGLIEIKILGKGCASCNRLEELTKEILFESGIAADVEHIRDLAEIARYGLISTPALIINRKVKASGRLPAKKDIERWIKEVTVKEDF